LPFISVRTILPVARLIRDRLRAMEKKHAKSLLDSSDQVGKTGAPTEHVPERLPPLGMEPDEPDRSPAVEPEDRRVDPAHPVPARRKGGV
jgi:hypothetical protein